MAIADEEEAFLHLAQRNYSEMKVEDFVMVAAVVAEDVALSWIRIHFFQGLEWLVEFADHIFEECCQLLFPPLMQDQDLGNER